MHGRRAPGPEGPSPAKSGFVPISESESSIQWTKPPFSTAGTPGDRALLRRLVLFPASPHGCKAERTHLREVENKDEDATPAVQAVQVRIALLPVVVEHRHQAWTRDEGSREGRLMGTGAGEVTRGKPDSQGPTSGLLSQQPVSLPGMPGRGRREAGSGGGEG